jgi:hypothetical protein
MLADLLEQNPDVPLPYQLGGGSGITFMFLSGEDARDRMVKLARLIPGTLSKGVSGGGEYGHYFDLDGKLAGIDVQLTAYRDQVCERVVTGTREVTKKVPDPSVTVPVVEVTETVEDVEWVCSPLLAGER